MSTLNMTQAALDVLAERRRQVEGEGWTPEHDDTHNAGEMALAAACYASPVKLYRQVDFANAVQFSDPWPWDWRWDKRTYDGNVLRSNAFTARKSQRDLLVKAGALILAEIERFDRAASLAPATETSGA